MSDNFSIHLLMYYQIGCFIRLLSLSFYYDVTLLNGKSTRQPSVNQFFDDIRERLHQAIEVYQKTPLSKVQFCFYLYIYMGFLVNISDQVVETDLRPRTGPSFLLFFERPSSSFFFSKILLFLLFYFS